MPRSGNPFVMASRQYIESQRTKGKSPGSNFFRFVPGSTTALNELTKEDRERRGIPDPNPKRQPTGFTGISKVLDDRKKATDKMSEPKSYAKGGMVKKTGMAKVHKGEKVLTKKQVKMTGKKRMR